MTIRLVCSVAVTALLAAIAAAGTSASSGGKTLVRGQPPTTHGLVAVAFSGSFADPRWGGHVDVIVAPDGRTVMSVAGIAPGPCDDRDFGHLLPGRDGATGPIFGAYGNAPIAANGTFAMKVRHAGQRRPFKPATFVTVSGEFSGDSVRGTLRASTTSRFDSCTANARFTARRVAG